MKKTVLFTYLFCLFGAVHAQPFEKTYNGVAFLSMSKDGNFLRMETCEDSSRVDWILDQQGNVVRKERNFKGSCGQKRLADGNFFVRKLTFDSLNRAVTTIQKIRPDGSVIRSKVVDIPCGDISLVRDDGSFVVTHRCLNPSVTHYVTALSGFDSLGNRVFYRALDTSMSFGSYLTVFSKDSFSYLQQTDYTTGTTSAIRKFDKNGNLLTTISFNSAGGIVGINPTGTKLLYELSSCRSTCTTFLMAYLDTQTGDDLTTIFPAWSEATRTISRKNAVHIDADDNVIVVASDWDYCTGRGGCPPPLSALNVWKYSKSGQLIFAKDFYYNIMLNGSTDLKPTVQAKNLIVADDGSLFIMGEKGGKTWLLKLNCTGEAAPNVPIAMPRGYSDFNDNPKGWITKTNIQNATIATLDSFTYNGFRTYSLFKEPLTTLQRGQSYPLSITAKTDVTRRLDSLFAGIWFDFNRNGQFDSLERITLTRRDSLFSGIVKVPNDAKKGLVNVRARVRFSQAPKPINAEPEGETEDYFVTIEGADTPCDSDGQAPTMLCPTNLIVTDTSRIAKWQTPNLNDNCDNAADIVLQSNFVNNTKFPLGKTTVNYSATDRNCNATNCSFTVTVQPIVNVVSEFTALPMRIFPNPTEGPLFVDLESIKAEDILFYCTNALGQVVFSEKRQVNIGQNRFSFDVSALPKGVYYMSIAVQQHPNTFRKFIKI
jgi:hypothetical protein